MMVVIVEFEMRAGAEAEFESALQQMQEQVKQYDGFFGEAPCSSIENENTFVALFYWRDREYEWTRSKQFLLCYYEQRGFAELSIRKSINTRIFGGTCR